MNNISPKQKGLNTELHCISYFSDCGFLVSTPYGDNGRYDLIVDVGGHLLRVQVKTSSEVVDAEDNITAIKFSCKSARINTKESYTKRYTKEEIDYFATYWNHRVFVVPVEETSTEKVLHITELKNNQNDLVSFIDDYTIEKQWFKFLVDFQDFQELKSETNNIFIDWNQYNRVKTPITINTCKRCGKSISMRAEHCPECAKFLSRKADRPSREELKQLIRTLPFTQIAAQYNVSDKAIVKWCKAEDLPSRKKDIVLYSDEEWEKV